jgi:hypothetical protein
MLAEIDARLHSDDGIAPDLFEASRQEIFRLLEKDKFDRFKKSAPFKYFLGRLGIL